MKKIKFLVAAISLGMLFTSCESNGHEDHSNDENHSEMESHEGHDHESEELKLNDGKKWKINKEMMEHINDMKSQVSTFSKAEKKDYAALGESLTANINLLTSSCTMTGESHDELHKWLHPYIEMVGELTDVSDDKSAAKKFGQIQESIATFNQYFE